MVINFLTISRDDLLFAFNHYNEFIDKGYEKIPYSEWQVLKSVLQNHKYKEFHFYFNREKTFYIAFGDCSDVMYCSPLTSTSNKDFIVYLQKEINVDYWLIDNIFYYDASYKPFDRWLNKANIVSGCNERDYLILLNIYNLFFHDPSDYHGLPTYVKNTLRDKHLSYFHLIDTYTYEMEDGEAVVEPGEVIKFKNKEYIKIEKEERNKDNMNTSLFKNFSFGPLTDNTKVKLSMYGLAVQNSTGTWVAYDKAQNRIVDVDILSFDANEYLYVMPVALNQVAVGDTVIHNRVPVIVTEVAPNGTTINVIDPMAGESKVIMPTRSPFGFDFISKVVNLLGGFLGDSLGASADAPFGNMLLPLLLSSNDSGNLKDVLPLLMLGNSGNGMNTQAMLPFLLFSGNGKSIDPMTLLLASGALGNANPFAAPAASK